MSLTDDIIKDILMNLFEVTRTHPQGGSLIDVSLINHDREHYQRDLIEDLVAKHRKVLVANPDMPWCGIVAKREDGTYWSINGQHHTEAALREGIQKLRYLIIPSTGWEYEKNIFELYQEYQHSTK